LYFGKRFISIKTLFDDAVKIGLTNAKLQQGDVFFAPYEKATPKHAAAGPRQPHLQTHGEPFLR
jgi:hypothetical protein